MTVASRSSSGVPRRPAIYVRISDDREGNQLGIRRQEKECRDRTDRLGWPEALTYSDPSISASSGALRPGYMALLDAIRSGDVDGLAVWHVDRLYRRPIELESLIDLLERQPGFPIVTVTAGDIDVSTASGRLNARILVSVAKGEIERSSERLRAKHRELAREGKLGSGGGHRPFGFGEDRITHRPAEANEIRKAVASILAGASINSVRRDWARREVKTPVGGFWNHTPIRNMLTSPRVAGLREHNGSLTKAVWDPIISPEDRDRLLAVLATRKAGLSPETTARKYLLASMLVCGLCHKKMIGRTRTDGSGRLSYLCVRDATTGNCGKMRVVADPLHKLVTEMVFAVAEDPARARTLAKETRVAPALQMARNAVAADEARLTELAQIWADGEITRTEWITAREKIEDRLQQNRKLVAASDIPTGPVLTDAHMLRSAWEQFDLSQKRAVIRKLVVRVTINPTRKGPRFNPERVAVEWRI